MTDTETGTVAGAFGETVAEALRAGTRAPSPHDIQPWLFAARDGEIDVVLDIRPALALGGPACAVSMLPDRRRPESLAALRLGVREGRGS